MTTNETLIETYERVIKRHLGLSRDGSGGYSCTQGCVTGVRRGEFDGHRLAVFLDEVRPLTPERIELTDPNDPRWRDGALVEVECHRPDSEFVNTFRRRVFNGMAHWENLAGYLSSPNWRVYLIEEAPEDPRLALIREYVSDPEDAVALLARLDEVQA